MQPFVVLYRKGSDTQSITPPAAFTCSAHSVEHAEYLCELKTPGCEIVWVTETDDKKIAYEEYFEPMVNEDTDES